MKKSFASDNYSGAHPEIIQAIMDANVGHAGAYGNDEYTARATRRFEELFGPGIGVYFVYSGTGANVLGLKAALRPYQAVICSEVAHINIDETGAPENIIGCKLLPIPTRDGKITIEGIQAYTGILGDEHAAQPKVISITQPTEYGTLYTPEEIAAIAGFARQYDLYLHMDGARISNAAVALDLPFRAFTRDLGVDILSFGGAKNGLLFGEAVLFFNPALGGDFKFLRKQGLQLASKMRFIAAQFEALLANDLWKRSARHANRMAQLLARKLEDIPQVTITQKVEANFVFARLPREAVPTLRAAYPFYGGGRDDEATWEVRWMTSFDTTEDDIEDFTALIKRSVA